MFIKKILFIIGLIGFLMMLKAGTKIFNYNNLSETKAAEISETLDKCQTSSGLVEAFKLEFPDIDHEKIMNSVSSLELEDVKLSVLKNVMIDIVSETGIKHFLSKKEFKGLFWMGFLFIAGFIILGSCIYLNYRYLRLKNPWHN
ncbi:hypothetical protein HOG11_00640 [bacterium]|jgi:hypothetical protein|nr:hypothetical protein [bacterium]MBT4764355.1 hypothetical protein [bacterium]MBT5401726.1 hypothetical protein [bacterium]